MAEEFKITWSAGHALVTRGKETPDGMKEWEFNAAVVKYAMELMANYQGVKQLRVDDPTGKKDISLDDRSDKVNAFKPDLHVDVHANGYGSGGWNDAGGIETYVYKKTLAQAVKVATAVNNNLVKVSGLKNRGVKEANLHMLRETKMTAILPECGFMTNRAEAALLKTDKYRRACAAAIVAGIVSSYGLKEIEKKVEIKPVTSPDHAYKIQKGDTLWSIAQEKDVTVADILEVNRGLDVDNLQIGQVIQLPRLFSLDKLPQKSSHTYRLAKLIDTASEEHVEKYKKDGYYLIGLPSDQK